MLTDEEKADLVGETANAIKGMAEGNIICLEDVSPISHTVNVKVKGENLDFSNVKITKTNRNVLSYTDSFTQTNNGITVSYDKTDGTFTINGKPNSNTIYVGSYYLRKLLVGKGNMYTFSLEHISGTADGIAEGVACVFFIGCSDTKGGSNINWINARLNNENTITTRTIAASGELLRNTWLYISPVESSPTFINYKFRMCLEYGDSFTECVAPEITEHTLSADGTAKITSLAPTMTLLSDTIGATIEAEYNRDTNKVIEKLTKAIVELGGTI